MQTCTRTRVFVVMKIETARKDNEIELAPMLRLSPTQSDLRAVDDLS